MKSLDLSVPVVVGPWHGGARVGLRLRQRPVKQEEEVLL